MAVSESNEITVRLSHLHTLLINQFSSYSEKDLRTQYHPDLSQLGWHLNHIAFIEQYWLREVVLGDDSRTKDIHQDYFPELVNKAKRGSLPGITDFAQLYESFSATEDLWAEISSGQNDHPLMKNNYIGWFLLQHGQQHLETMLMVLHERALNTVSVPNFATGKFDAVDPVLPELLKASGDYEVGSNDILACDNEQAVHVESLEAFFLAGRPVSNAEYMGFIEADGYYRQEFWTNEAWCWETKNSVNAPRYWRQDNDANWYSLSLNGPQDLVASEAVSGINWYEAEAFARYAACRLPHESEWEVAMKGDSGLLATTGQAWEWCANAFFPYPGFQAFPYERYSLPWFDDNHYTLKGRSPYTAECVSSPSFRNFYQPDKRHIFAGLRLACDSW
jgi:iron(II)-dependent oxidoreductase